MDYYQKYLKYKQKYIDLKNQIGGQLDCTPIVAGTIDVNYIISAHGSLIKQTLIDGKARDPKVRFITYIEKGSTLKELDARAIQGWLQHRDPTNPCKNNFPSKNRNISADKVHTFEEFPDMHLSGDKNGKFKTGILDATRIPDTMASPGSAFPEPVQTWYPDTEITLSAALVIIDSYHRTKYPTVPSYKVHLLTCSAGRPISLLKPVTMPGTTKEFPFYLLIPLYPSGIPASMWNQLLNIEGKPIYRYIDDISLDHKIFTGFGELTLREASWTCFLSIRDNDPSNCFFYYYDETYDSSPGGRGPAPAPRHAPLDHTPAAAGGPA